QKNRSFRPGEGVTVELTARHTSDGRVDSHQSDDEPSPVPSTSSSPRLWVMEVLTDRQMSDGPSRRLSLRP
ncbi:hypothetical protein HAX54_000561, partial [Datura stramonium]|nr:hypothetical protein [Datura stramonium]